MSKQYLTQSDLQRLARQKRTVSQAEPGSPAETLLRAQAKHDREALED